MSVIHTKVSLNQQKLIPMQYVVCTSYVSRRGYFVIYRIIFSQMKIIEGHEDKYEVLKNMYLSTKMSIQVR